MIELIGATAIYLTAMQAGINAPRDALRTCLKQAGAKAKSEKVAADGIEAYIRNACSGQMSSFKSALISFDVKNGISRKSASEGADMMVDDFVGSTVDNYKFLATVNQPAPQAAPAATPPATPASAPQPPK